MFDGTFVLPTTKEFGFHTKAEKVTTNQITRSIFQLLIKISYVFQSFSNFAIKRTTMADFVLELHGQYNKIELNYVVP